jgi:single-strand DNA-binding protein
MNVLTISGNLGKDAVVRKAGDQSVAGFSIAMKSGYGDKAQTIWVDCSLWGKQAESGLVQYLKKGQFVVLSGEMGTREHEGKTYITLRVASVTLGGKSEAAQPVQQPAAAPRQQPQAAGYQQTPQGHPAQPKQPLPQQNYQPQIGQPFQAPDFDADPF